MPIGDQLLFNFAKKVFRTNEFEHFKALFYLRDSRDERIRALANAELLSFMSKLKQHLEGLDTQKVHAVG